MSPDAPDRPGFADPVADAQACFRALLGAMSHPGSLHDLPAAPDAPPLDPATAAVLLTLADADAPLWLDDALRPAGAWLAFHAGAVAAPRAGAAIVCACALPPLAALACGGDDSPEAGATVVLQLPNLRGGPTLSLEGPGLRAGGRLAAQGLPADFASQWQANARLFPRGVDLVLCAGRSLCALPRSVQVEAG